MKRPDTTHNLGIACAEANQTGAQFDPVGACHDQAKAVAILGGSRQGQRQLLGRVFDGIVQKAGSGHIVVAPTCFHHEIGAAVADEAVGSVTARQRVVATAPDQRVVAAATDQQHIDQCFRGVDVVCPLIAQD